MKALYTSKSNNVKTGNIPQQFIGETRELSKESCSGCPLLKPKINENGEPEEIPCYAQNGTEGYFGHNSVIRANKNGKDYTLDNALKNRAKTAKYVRLGSIGDPSAVEDVLEVGQTIREEGLGVLSYTHFWDSRGEFLKGEAMASCDTWEEAEEATNRGWRATVHVDKLEQKQGKTETGKRFTLCPAQRTDNRIKCNDCGLCDAKRDAAEIIVFLNH